MTAATLVLIMNILWLGTAAVHFCGRPLRSTFLLIRNGDATEAGRRGAAGAVSFLGGLNVALLVLAALTLYRLDAFTPTLLTVPITALLVGHASQFLVNVPVAMAEWHGRDAPWRVLKGSMLFIFCMDFLLAVANLFLLVRIM